MCLAIFGGRLTTELQLLFALRVGIAWDMLGPLARFRSKLVRGVPGMSVTSAVKGVWWLS